MIYVILTDQRYLLVFAMPGYIIMFLSFSIKGIVSRRVLIWIKVDILLDTLLDILYVTIDAIRDDSVEVDRVSASRLYLCDSSILRYP